MTTPKHIKEDIEVWFKADPDNPEEHHWGGQRFKVKILEVGEFGSAYVQRGAGNSTWVSFSELYPLKPIPNKTERKKIAEKVKKAFDDFAKEVESAEENHLEVYFYLDLDDWNGRCIDISYQPPTPPKETY